MKSVNVGVILGEAAKRAKRSVGISNGNQLADVVHPKLALQGQLTSKVLVAVFGSIAFRAFIVFYFLAQAVEGFGVTVESLLIKYGKNILDEQFLLNRLAAAAIDIYANVVVLSRATRALNLNFPSASHEEKLARVWCNEVIHAR